MLTPFQETLTITIARTKLCLRYIERGNPRARCHLNALMQDWLRTSEDLSP